MPHSRSESEERAIIIALTKLSTAFDRDMPEVLQEVYLDSLADFSVEQIERSIGEGIQTLKFFPRVAELRQLVEGSGDDRSNSAWSSLLRAMADGGYASVKFLDPAIATALDATFDGWVQACRTVAMADEMMIASYYKRFVPAYLTARRFPREIETYRPGAYEIQNRGVDWSSRGATYRNPVLLVGVAHIQELRLPFDARTGALVAEARAMLDAAGTEQGAQRLIEYAKGTGPQTALGVGVPQLALPPAYEDKPVSPEEASAIVKKIETMTGLRLIKPMEAQSDAA